MATQKDVFFSPQDNMEEHLCFAEELVYKYDWEAADRLDFESRLFQIKQKLLDECLNLSVVGEFGTGKSTFINALLRSDDFLVSSSLQGTTVAATIVENYPQCGILLEHMNGQQEYKTFDSPEALCEGLIAFTTDSQVARNLYNVKIRMPCEHLSTGFRIIDTPGLNANENWHEKVTLRTIEEMSDMSVLIIDANKPLTSTFCDFVKLTLSDVLDKCVFLVTRIDMIRKRERQGVLDYLKIKIEKEFSLTDPIVLPYASVAVLDELYCDPTELSALSHKTEESLLEFMREKKELTLRKKIEQLINDMYFSLSEKLRLLSEGCKDELEILLRSRQIDLAPFVKEQLAMRCDSFAQAAVPIRTEILDRLTELSKQCHQNIINEIEAQSSVNALKSLIEERLTELCENQAKGFIEEGSKEYLALQTLFADEMLTFHKEFQAQFKDIDILLVDLCNELYENTSLPLLDYTNLQNTGSNLSSRISRAKKVPIGSAAAGAALGTAISPGLGTIVGGVVGLLIGSPKIGKLKEKTKQELNEPLSAYFNDILINITSCIDTYIENLSIAIHEEINKYLDTYHETISERIRMEKERIANTEKKIIEIQKDLKSVTLRGQSFNPQGKDDIIGNNQL